MINNELGMSSLLNVNVDIDIKDSNKYIYNVYGSTYLLDKTYFDDAYASVQALFMQYIKEIYALINGDLGFPSRSSIKESD